jgi:hypothetical protein
LKFLRKDKKGLPINFELQGGNAMSDKKTINTCSFMTRKLSRDRIFRFMKRGERSLIRVTLFLSLVGLLIASAPSESGAELISTMEMTIPSFHSYAFDIDQTTFSFSFPGEATAFLYSVGNGNLDSNFVGFPVGDIALIERGGNVPFSVKISNARDAGASGAIIYDNQVINPIFHGSYGGGDPYIPSVMTTRQVGLDLLDLMKNGPVTVHLLVQNVPEPTTMLLLVSGLIGLVAVRRRFNK